MYGFYNGNAQYAQQEFHPRIENSRQSNIFYLLKSLQRSRSFPSISATAEWQDQDYIGHEENLDRLSIIQTTAPDEFLIEWVYLVVRHCDYFDTINSILLI